MLIEASLGNENEINNADESQFILLPEGIKNGVTSGLVLHDLILGIEDCILGSNSTGFYRLARSPLVVAEAISKRIPEFNPKFSTPEIILQLTLLRSKMAEIEYIDLIDFFPQIFFTLDLPFSMQNTSITMDVLPVIYPFLNDPQYASMNIWVSTFQDSISSGISSFFQIDGFGSQSGLHFVKDFLRNSIRLSKSGKFLRNIMHVPDQDQLEDTASAFKFLLNRSD
ncbi:hypothetical protein KBD45_05630 [Candidatus Dojkabacteria bacterium]|nr:hypothetical protein [Candidatus Dojkabacteria bacterium]